MEAGVTRCGRFVVYNDDRRAMQVCTVEGSGDGGRRAVPQDDTARTDPTLCRLGSRAFATGGR